MNSVYKKNLIFIEKFYENQKNKLKNNKIFYFIFLIPNIISILYYCFLASPIYQSNSILLVTNPSRKDSDNITTLLSGSSENTNSGAYLLKERILSWDSFSNFNKKFDIIKLYSSGDFVSRVGGLTSLWSKGDVSLWHYYQKNIGVNIDEQTGITKITINAYNSNISYEISDFLINDTIKYLNNLNKTQDNYFISSSKEEVQRLEDKIKSDERNIQNWRIKSGYFDPSSDYNALTKHGLNLDEKQVSFQGQYNFSKENIPNNPATKEIKKQLDNINDSSKKAHNSAKSLFLKSSSYESLIIQRDLDEKLLNSAKIALQEARIKSFQNHYYLKIISNPSHPESPSRPKRIESILIILVSTLILKLILS